MTDFNELKLGKNTKYIIYKLSDDWKSIVVDEKSSDGEWDNFRDKLVSAKSKSKTGKEGPGPRYAVYDFEYESAEGGRRNKITFIAWSPDNAGIQVGYLPLFFPHWLWCARLLRCIASHRGMWSCIRRVVLVTLADLPCFLATTQPKMVYASSKESLKRSLNGLAVELQANDEDDLEYESVLKMISKGR